MQPSCGGVCFVSFWGGVWEVFLFGWLGFFFFYFYSPKDSEPSHSLLVPADPEC